MCSFVDEELRTLDLGDTRREDRLAFMVERFAAHPDASIPKAFGHWKDIKAAYRFLSNPDVDREQIRAALQDACVGRICEQSGMILAIQDTTSIDFSAHPATTGLGPVGGGNGSAGHGLFLHSTLAVGADGVPLGFLHQKDWVRDPDAVGKRHQRRELPIEDKESYRWLEALKAVHAAVPEHISVLNIADREADIFELFAQQRPANSHFLIRATRDRRVEGEHRLLWTAVEASEEIGRYEQLVRRHSTHEMVQVTFAVRVCEVTLRPPKNGVHDPNLKPVQLTAIEACEQGPLPEGAKPVHWLLLTDLSVPDLHTARELIGCYGLRWLIERYHYTLKSGCRLEDSQLRTAEALLLLVSVYCIVAWRLLWMTYAAREYPDAPCTIAFSDVEWHLLYWREHGRKALPKEPPSLRDAVRWLARLGGFIGRKGDGEPGVKVLWQGIAVLHENVIGYLIATGKTPEDVGNA